MADHADITARQSEIESTLHQLEETTDTHARAESTWIALDEGRKVGIQREFMLADGNVEERKAKASERWARTPVADGSPVTMQMAWQMALEDRTQARFRRETLMARLSALQSLLKADILFIPSDTKSP